MSIEPLVSLWKDARTGLIHEVERIPADQFCFKATPETRSVAEILQHIVQVQKALVGEICRPDTNLQRQSILAHIEEYSPGVAKILDKEQLIDLLGTSIDDALAKVDEYGDKLNENTARFDGKVTSKLAILTFAMSHEMYHRGQLTVYERLLQVEPALTERLKKFLANA